MTVDLPVLYRNYLVFLTMIECNALAFALFTGSFVLIALVIGDSEFYASIVVILAVFFLAFLVRHLVFSLFLI